MPRWLDRLVGRSVVDLAGEVDAALGRLAHARGTEAACEEALGLARQDVAKAQADVAAARDALFKEHPDLAPTGHTQPTTKEAPVAQPDPTNPALLPGQDPSKFEVIAVDDDNDPRYTAGAGTVIDPRDDADLPPIEWTEHDG